VDLGNKFIAIFVEKRDILKRVVLENKHTIIQRIFFNHPVPTQTPILFYQEFTVTRLTQLRNPQITLEELIRMRIIGNTLIYYHPTQNKPHGSNSDLH